ncbi:MAG: CopD family protein [Stellaceae bacterium]
MNTLLLVGSTEAMLRTAYRRLLAVKILLFLAMVVIALINRFYVTPRISKDFRAAIGALDRRAGIGTLPPAILGGRN